MPKSKIKSSVQKELVRRGVTGLDAADHSKSSGPLHSKSHDKSKADSDDKLLSDVRTMDAAAFKKYADRLATLKRIKTPVK